MTRSGDVTWEQPEKRRAGPSSCTQPVISTVVAVTTTLTPSPPPPPGRYRQRHRSAALQTLRVAQAPPSTAARSARAAHPGAEGECGAPRVHARAKAPGRREE